MKKIVRVIGQVLSWLLVAVTLAFMVFTILTVRSQGADRSVFGVRLLVVLSDSMSATDFSAGDLIFVREVDPTQLQVGDIISYISVDEDSYGSMITHKIRSIQQQDGQLSFTTYGTTTGTEDDTPAYSQNVKGKYIGRIPKVGLITQKLKNHPAYLLVLLLAVLAFYVLSGVLSAWLEKRRQEQSKAISKSCHCEMTSTIPEEQTGDSGDNPQGGVQTEDETQ